MTAGQMKHTANNYSPSWPSKQLIGLTNLVRLIRSFTWSQMIA